MTQYCHLSNRELTLFSQAFHTPVINVPGFKGENGMPIGLSLVAPRYEDRRLLRVAKAVGNVFEQEGGWTRQL